MNDEKVMKVLELYKPYQNKEKYRIRHSWFTGEIRFTAQILLTIFFLPNPLLKGHKIPLWEFFSQRQGKSIDCDLIDRFFDEKYDAARSLQGDKEVPDT